MEIHNRYLKCINYLPVNLTDRSVVVGVVNEWSVSDMAMLVELNVVTL